MAKLNRGRSSDSLDNGGDDVVCSSSGSSSPTYFTSDDENNTDNLFLISGQPLGKSRSRTSQTSTVHSSNIHKVGENSKNAAVLLTRQVEEDEEEDDSNLFGRTGPQLESMPIQFSNGPYSISGAYPSTISVAPGPIPTGSSYMPGYPPLIRPNTNRGMNNITVRMCARLLECRSLIEAIEFIEQNRDLIESLTNIVTHEAPAFRNYEISNYQIDHSVRESFNPNFWLDREPIVTTADGNCQYHEVSLSLTGTEDYTPEVRLATAIAVIDNREWFDSMLKLIDRGTVLDLVHTIARNYSWGDETTLKAIAVAIKKRIFLYTCNVGKKDYEMVKLLNKEELLDAFREKEYRGGTGIHMYADPLVHVPTNNYIMLFHKSEHFIAVLPTGTNLTMFEPYNPIVPVFS